MITTLKSHRRFEPAATRRVERNAFAGCTMSALAHLHGWAASRSMRLLWGILVWLLSEAQLDAQVYAFGIGPIRGPITLVRIDEHRWTAGWFGVVQLRTRNSADAPWVRQTTLHGGTWSVTARLPAAAIGMALGTPFLLMVALVGRVFCVTDRVTIPANQRLEAKVTCVSVNCGCGKGTSVGVVYRHG